MNDMHQMEFLGYKVYGDADLIFGIIATVTSCAIFLQSFPTFWRIYMAKSDITNEVAPYTVMAMQMSFFIWSYYDNVESSDFQHLCLEISYCIAIVLENIYTLIYATHTTSEFKGLVLGCMAGIEIFVCIMLSKCMGDLRFKYNDPRRKEIVGPVAAVFGIIMYASPLFSIIEAYMKKKSVNYLPLQDCTYLCLNAIAWFIYSSLPATFDRYLAIANGAGVIMGVIQILACILFVKFQVGVESDIHESWCEITIET